MSSDSSLTDEDIFIGKFKLKEIKRMLFPKRQSFSGCEEFQSDDTVLENDTSINIIKTSSEPNLLYESSITLVESSTLTIPNSSSPPLKQVFSLEGEGKSYVNDDEVNELDNTFELVEYILKHGSEHEQSTGQDKLSCNTPSDNAKRVFHSTQKEEASKITWDSMEAQSFDTIHNEHSKTDNMNTISHTNNFMENVGKITTPIDTKFKAPVFKTPVNPVSQPKLPNSSSAKKNNSKNDTFKHIVSPVASYIKKSPQVPLLTDVKPKKPLPSSSCIPKLVSLSQTSKADKENVNLPTLAYKNAKTTKVINIPDKLKLPQNQWAQKVSTSLPRPVVIKHAHREINYSQKIAKPQVNESFDNLLLRQADVSVCTQKSAFK